MRSVAAPTDSEASEATASGSVAGGAYTDISEQYAKYAKGTVKTSEWL